jgi:hypothetical protein
MLHYRITVTTLLFIFISYILIIGNVTHIKATQFNLTFYVPPEDGQSRLKHIVVKNETLLENKNFVGRKILIIITFLLHLLLEFVLK